MLGCWRFAKLAVCWAVMFGTALMVAVAAQVDISYLADSWKWSDPKTGGVLTNVTLSANGEYRGGPLPPELGGPNGLGANSFEFKDGTLAFRYKKTGRARIDDMLIGRVKKIDGNKFQFTVTGGYYGQRSLAKIFVFERIQ